MPENEALSFIFGGNTGLTQEELKKRRARVAAELARQHPFPKNIGEGLTYLGNSIGDVGLEWRLRQAEAEALKRQQGIVTGAPPESDGSNPIARPSDRPVVTVAPPPAAAPAAAPPARPVRTERVTPSVAPEQQPPALAEPGVTTDAPREGPIVQPRIEVVNPPPVTAPPPDTQPLPPVETAPPPNTDSPPPFFEGRPNNQVSQPHPALAVPHLGGPRFSPPPTRAEQMSQQMRQPVPVPQASPDAFGGRFGGDQLRAMEGEGEPVPYFDESASLPRGVAQREPLRRTDRLPLPPQPEFAEEGSPFNSMDAAAPELPSAPPPIGRAVPMPRPRPDVEGGLNPLDQRAAVPLNLQERRAAAVAGIESGGERDPYTSVGAVTRGDRPYGKYQVMGRNVPEWTQAATGQRMTPQQFLASREAQDATFQHRFGQYADRYGEEGAARAWFGGERGMRNLNATDQHGRLSVSTYGQDYMRRFGAPGQAETPTDGEVVQPRPQPQEVSQPPRQATMIGGGQPQDPRAAIVQALVDQQGGPREASQSFTDPSGGGQQNPILADLTGPQATQTGASPTAGRSTSTSAASGNLPIRVSDISPIPIAQRGGSMGAPPVSSDMQRGPAVPQAPGVDPRANEPIPDTVQPPPLVPPGPRPEPPTRLDPTPAERYWRAVERDPYASDTTKAHAKEVIAREAHIREWKQKQVDDNYNYLRGRHDHDTDEYNKRVREAPKEALEQLAIRLKIAKDQADLRNQPLVSAKMQADLDKVLKELNEPHRVSIAGTQFEQAPTRPGQQPQPYKVSPGLPQPKEEPLTQQQSEALIFVQRVKPDLRVLEDLDHGAVLADPAEAFRGNIPLIGNMTATDAYRRARNAAINFEGGFMKLVSGAAVSPSEYGRNMPAFLPMAGDDRNELIEKTARRERFTRAVESVTGRAGMEKIREQMDAENDNYRFRAEGRKDPVHVQSIEEARGLVPGRRIVLPDGSPGIVPRRRRE